jgi:HlyD family secretion protein
MKRSFRIVVAVLLLALVAGAFLAVRPQPVPVDVARASRGLLEQVVDDEGRARIRERYTVSAPVAGTLARIDLHEGDLVEPGGVVARLLPLASPLLDPEARKAAEQRLAAALDSFDQAKATVDRAELASTQTARDLERAASLAKTGALPQAQLDEASTDARIRAAELASARFAAKVAAHEIEQARAAVARYRPGSSTSEQFEISSPVHGQVLHVLHQSEGVVEAGAALMEVGDPGALEIVADVLSQDAVSIKPGMRARVVHWGGARALAAKVRRVEPAAFTKTSALGVEEQRVNVLLDPDGPADGWRELGDGFAVEVQITVWSRQDVVQLPTSALFRQGERWALFVATGHRATLRAVAPGHRGPLETEIEGGVAPGEEVIIHPGPGVHDGVRVEVR